LIPTPPDPFDEWLRQPVKVSPPDSPYEVRRITPDEYERLWDTVDAAFERKRPRAQYEWLYRHNPFGRARCWVVVERSSGDFIKVGSYFPWPIWRGREVLMGSFGGDAATLPHWQRKGLSAVRKEIRTSHPWSPRICTISGPNAKSRAVSQALGLGGNDLGLLPGGVAVLRGSEALGRLPLPRALRGPLGAVADGLFSVLPGRGARSLGGARSRIEPVARFTTDFDALTLEHMMFHQFWSPHNADFLNWRYLDHPTESFVAIALIEEERMRGYAVIRLAESRATLSEFVVARGRDARSLLRGAIGVALEAGCSYLTFFATPGFPHWGLLRRAGFLPYDSKNFAEASCRSLEPDVQQMENWQLLPGDRDYR